MITLSQDFEIPEFIQRLLPSGGNKASRGVCTLDQYYAPFSGQKVKIKCFPIKAFKSINIFKVIN